MRPAYKPVNTCLAGFLLYFTISGNSFWQKRFLNIPLQNATLVSKETKIYI